MSTLTTTTDGTDGTSDSFFDNKEEDDDEDDDALSSLSSFSSHSSDNEGSSHPNDPTNAVRSRKSTRPTNQRARDSFRLHQDLARHQELLADSQRLNASLKRCLAWTDELISEGRRALDYTVRVSEIAIGGRVLGEDEAVEGFGFEPRRGLLSPSLEEPVEGVFFGGHGDAAVDGQAIPAAVLLPEEAVAQEAEDAADSKVNEETGNNVDGHNKRDSFGVGVQVGMAVPLLFEGLGLQQSPKKNTTQQHMHAS
jgi:hypothetical protein